MLLPMHALLNFVFYNLQQQRIAAIIFFHCWAPAAELDFMLQRLSSNDAVFIQLRHIGRNVTGIDDLEIEYLQRNRLPTLGVFSDFNCANSLQLLQLASRQRLFNQHYHWLVHDEQANLAEFQAVFGHFNMSVDADLTYVQSSQAKNYSSFLLYDAYNNGYHLGGGLNVTIDKEIACSRRACHLLRHHSALHERTKYGNRNRQSDITMRVTTVVTKRDLTLPAAQLLEFLASTNNTHIDGIARFGFQLVVLLQQQLACNFVYIYTDRWSTSEVAGGTVGDIITKTADLASTPFLATAGRLQYVSALLETGAFRSVCMFRTPRNAAIQYGLFLEPFSAAVWWGFISVLAIATLLLWYIFFVEWKSMCRCVPAVPSLLTTCLLTFGSACIQSTSLMPHSSGGRMAFFALSLITFLVYNYYTSTVVSSLLSSQVKSSIRTLAQLADSTLEVGLEPLPFTMSYLNLPEVRRFVERKINAQQHPQDVWLSADEGVRKVRTKPGYVFIFEASSGYALVAKYYEPHEICDLNEIMLRPEEALYTHLHRNSTYKELLRLRQLRLLETGVYAKHHRYWVRTKLSCFSKNYVINVGMEYVAPLFLMLLLAYVLVLIFCSVEVLWAHYVSPTATTATNAVP